MHTIVQNIQQTESAEEFVVDVLIDGISKSFRVQVSLPELRSITPLDQDFFDTFEFSMAAPKIATLVVAAYKGEPLSLPVDLGSS